MILFICITLSFTLMGYIFCMILSKYTVNRIIQPTVKTPVFSKEYLRPRKHANESTDAYFDHTKITIGSRSNAALQSIFDLLIKEYIEFWYRPFTSNQDFMIQLKMFLQYACAVIVQRIKRIDISDFIVNRFIPHFFDHIVHILSLTCSDKLNSTGVGDKESQTTLNENHLHKSSLTSCSEEAILCAFGDRLHAALYSRQAEVMYLRALVNRLLPIVGMPPSLSTSEMHKSKEPSVDCSHRLRRNRHVYNSPGHTYGGSSERGHNSPVVSRSASTGALFIQKFMELGCNPSLSSFLIEIVSTCVLLPAMDTLANSDFINHLILLSFPECTKPTESAVRSDCENVPILEAYIHDWEKWLQKKQSSLLHIDKLLNHQDELYPFMQYMKSVKSIEPLTVLLLMYQINSRVAKFMLSSDDCHEISAQLQHILSILKHQLYSSTTTTTSNNNSSNNHSHSNHNEQKNNTEKEENDHLVDDTTTDADGHHHHQRHYSMQPMSKLEPSHQQQHLSTTNTKDLQYFFNISKEFEVLIRNCLEQQCTTPETIIKLVNTTQWKKTYQSVCQTVELRFIPMYLESPEYINYTFGFTRSPTPSISTSLHKIGVSPKRDIRRVAAQSTGTSQQQQQQTGLFGNALSNVFSSQSNDTQSVGNMDPTKLSIRRNQKDRFNEPTNRSNRPPNTNSTTTTTNTNNSSTMNDDFITNQHVIGIKHLPETMKQFNLSECRVYIRGLSRPEIVSSLSSPASSAAAVASAASNTRYPYISSTNTATTHSPMMMTSTTVPMINLHASHSTNHLPVMMMTTTGTTSTTAAALSTLSPSTTAVRDINYRNKITNELNQLMNPSLQNLMPSASPSSAASASASLSSSFGSLPQLSTQFMFNVITEIVINNGIHKQIAKVARKYSEFYVLEQKLIEFHGSFITKQLPKRQLTPRTMEFLESKCDVFQSYLQKGQFLDGFLSTYFLSCHPQPMETIQSSKSLSNHSTNGNGIHASSSSSNPLLLNTTTNNHINSSSGDTNSLTNRLTDRNFLQKSTSNHLKLDRYSVEEKHIDYYSRYVFNSPQHKHPSRTSLDHRLRSRIYWNNAGITTYENLKDTIVSPVESSKLSTVHLTNFAEIVFYLFEKLITLSFQHENKNNSNPSQKISSSNGENKSSSSSSPSSASSSFFHSSKSSPFEITNSLKQDDTIPSQQSFIDPWDITDPCWSEALLNGPPVSNLIPNTNNNAKHESNHHRTSSSSPSSSLSLSSNEPRSNHAQSTLNIEQIQSTINDTHCLPIISITMHDLYHALMELYVSIKKQCKIYLNYFLLKFNTILFVLFQSTINYWLINYTLRFMYHNIISDENLANMLNNIEKNIFSHSSKKIDMDKSERKEKARMAIEKAILNITGLSYITDIELLRDQLIRIFNCFQYCKCNKQLTYILLDQFLLELFPELNLTHSDNDNISINDDT
ncbi:unnamed protein product [Schistosoma turkestanicum]|nr:unnamed protein product [Schistosoma turkestanicum]